MTKFVYIIMKDDNIDCFSNLSKLTAKYINIGYYQVYYKLQQDNIIKINGYTIIKAVIK